MPAKQETPKNEPDKEQNANAFKLWINRGVLVEIAKSIGAVHSDFDQRRLIATAPRLDSLELKARVQLVRDQLRELLPANYLSALRILIASLESKKLKGFALWPYAEFIQTFGLEHRQESLEALAILTELFTGEFAVRPFLKKDTKATLQFLLKCAGDSNEHLRRWASEGTRPRLPWGERLDVFIKNPNLTLPILERLKNDESLYVRKSVANHLNDISKDHPALVIKILKRWNKETIEKHEAKIRWITNRALRSLIKQGNPDALSVIGVSSKARVKVSAFKINGKKFKVGDQIEIAFTLHSLANAKQRVVVDYVVHYMKSNGATAPKVFKLKTFELAAKDVLKIEKRHHLKAVTTRRHYPGAHVLEIQVNGTIQARTTWLLA